MSIPKDRKAPPRKLTPKEIEAERTRAIAAIRTKKRWAEKRKRKEAPK